MKILHRLILRETILATSVAVGIFVFALLLGNALRDVIGLLAEGRLPLRFFAEMVLLLVPYVMAYALPMGCLTGILLVLGRLSSTREIVAMKASGMSLWSISWPILAFAVFGAFLSGWFNAYYGPKTRTEYRENLANLVRLDPLAFLESRTFIYDFPGLVLYAGERDGSRLGDLWIWQTDERGDVTSTLRADEAEISLDRERGLLVLSLRGGSIEVRPDPTAFQSTAAPTVRFESWTLRLELEELLGRIGARRKLSMYTVPELWERRTELLEAEKRGDPDAFAQRIALQTQVQQHFAMAYSVIAMAFLAIPLGIRLRRGETFSNIVLALVLALSYYFLIIAFGWFEKVPRARPDILVWVPNLLLQSLGLYFFIRAARR